MKTQFFLFILLMFSWAVSSQTVLSGTVRTKTGEGLSGANVYLEGTYDGASTDQNGTFRFETTETGIQTLVVSMLSYETHYEVGDVTFFKDLQIQLVETINSLTGVTLTAGTFEAGDNSKASVLKPLDIVTTAGAAGDFVGALQTLPGTTTVNEDGRLFVRGGRAEETQVFIDGLRVFQPFNASANNIPTRGRFSPFLFKGITFSTGGYSAEYGQALSSVLLLNTTDMPDQEKTDIAIMSVGGGIGHTKIWDDKSLSVNAQYINLAPYEALIPSDQGVQWNDPYESVAGEAVFRDMGENSMFKLYTGFNRAQLDIDQEDINFEDMVRFQLKNNNLYLNASHKYFFDSNWMLFSGASVSWDTNDIVLGENQVEARETAFHGKVKAKKGFNGRFNLNVGTELFNKQYEESFLAPDAMGIKSGFDDLLWAGFAEGDIYFSNDFAMKLGARVEHSSVLGQTTLSPRASLAYKSGEKAQFSLAYGAFYQNPLNRTLQYDDTLDAEKTAHFIVNYQYLDHGKTFRAEAYYKNYDQLVKYDTEVPMFNAMFENSGSGYASGIDIFWRDNKSIKNLDYWVSYSYLDTERDYINFEERATPNFAPRHNFSLVTKYWVEDWRSQVGLSYNFASGRPYNNPNTPDFMAEKTKPFNSMSLNWAYLIDQQKILYFSVNNALGFHNVNGYQYANAPNQEGIFERMAIRPAADTFFFVGFFWTISSDGQSNQLDNL